MVLSGTAFAQAQHKSNNKSIEQSRLNLVEYDERRLTYGFTLGLHVSSLRPQFSEAAFNRFPEGEAPTPIGPIETPQAFGFSIGFLGNLRAAQFLDVRFMPRVSFYNFNLEYYDLNTQTWEEPVRQAEFTTLDLSVSAKFKSARRGNYRMFLTGGVTPMVNVSGKKKMEEASDYLTVNGNNLTADVGFGVDMYFPLFKFSPEIRYSYGIPDIKAGNSGEYDPNFERLGSQVIALYLVFN